MATLTKLPMRAVVTVTATELRKLADQVEKACRECKLGQTTLVEEWIGNDVVIQWHFDQEKMPRVLHLTPDRLQVGDLWLHETAVGLCMRTVEYIDWSAKDKAWYVKVKETGRIELIEPHKTIKIERQ